MYEVSGCFNVFENRSSFEKKAPKESSYFFISIPPTFVPGEAVGKTLPEVKGGW